MVPEFVKLGDETYDDIIITIMSHVYAMHPVILSTLNTLDDPMYQILDQTGNDQPDAFKSLANHECNKTGYTRARTSSNNKPKSDAEINLAM
ncbi:hypothetical protein IFM46972_00894 [Aspergillus udagawae]|uniref:Uncharacterized protein n=1 Tax=Aspergillus udagawae TaxID=91492 RepID=A0A8H3RLS7_9EURO|nr:hypothetical protein IFM46972_00894 [Aspergillus udagawae]